MMNKNLFKSTRVMILTSLLMLSATSVSGEELYTVTEGNILDSETYRGFILHRNMCARCHGSYGQGMIGPNLADSLNNLSKEEFNDVVTNGRMAMPPWKSNAEVMAGLDNLYAYFKARADGAIGEVRPKKAE